MGEGWEEKEIYCKCNENNYESSSGIAGKINAIFIVNLIFRKEIALSTISSVLNEQ